jgi:predicted dehydrogenase
MCHFVESIRNRQAPCPGIEVGQTVMRIVDAAYRSAEENRAVDL